jgi:cytochrome c-type biogenesis protein CcmE
MNSGRFFPFLIAIIIAGIAFFIVKNSVPSAGSTDARFAMQISDLAKQLDKYEGKSIRIQGIIVPGSVYAEKNEFDIYFDLIDEDGSKIRVHYTKHLPDPFKEGRSAIAEGIITKGIVECSALTVKCPSKYKKSDLSEEDYDRYKEDNPEHFKDPPKDPPKDAPN